MKRRDFLQASAVTTAGLCFPEWASAAAQPSPQLETLDIRALGKSKWATRALVYIPKAAVAAKQSSLLLLLHGLGETVSEHRGIHAWGERYGLVQAYERLSSPPLSRRLPQRPYLSDAKLESINKSLEEAPFSPPITVCPYTPNPYNVKPRRRILNEYTDWLVEVLLPEVRRRLASRVAISRTGIDGCSLGGYMAIEAFLRRPEAFSTLGMVQGAIHKRSAKKYASRLSEAIERHAPRPIHLSTSTDDPFRDANDKLHFELYRRKIPCHLEVTPGPHNQAWLREIGTVDMLYWQARALRAMQSTEHATDSRGARGNDSPREPGHTR